MNFKYFHQFLIEITVYNLSNTTDFYSIYIILFAISFIKVYKQSSSY